MPGANCSIFGCSSSRKNKNVSIFKLPKATDEVTTKWRENLLHVITKDRVIDASLKQQIENDSLHICEKHFSEEQLYIYPTRKAIKEGEIPTLILGKPISLTSPRSTSSIQKREGSISQTVEKKKSCYHSYNEFHNRLSSSKLLQNNYEVLSHDGFTEIYSKDSLYLVPFVQLFVDVHLQFTIRIYAWLLPDDHIIYKKYKRSLKNITINNLLAELKCLSLCNGIDAADVRHSINIDKHVIPKHFSYDTYQVSDDESIHCQHEYLRAKLCELLIAEGLSSCPHCENMKITTMRELKKKDQNLLKPASSKAPVSKTAASRIKLTLQSQRLKCKQLEENVQALKKEIEKSSLPIDNHLSSDLKNIFQSSRSIPDFMKFFWEEQQKYLQASSDSQVRYHPQIIKYCLSIHAKSPSAYRDLRLDRKEGTGIMVLPSERTLRDYKNYIRPQRGFNPAVIKDLCSRTASFSQQERFISIIFDEMKVQEDLVWDKHTGELIGFVDLGDPSLNYSTLKNVQELASHVLVFLIKSIVNPLSYSLATFSTSGITSYQLYPLFWRAVAILETTCNLKVISSTADGAAPNRKFVRMHKEVNETNAGDIIYRSVNPYALPSEGERYIWFFGDPPHIMKTARNCLSKSGSSSSPRRMWNDGFEILWMHISQLFYEQLENGVKLTPKITADHINLTSYSVMNVRLAVQVLSETMGQVLLEYGPPEAVGTANFCLMFDKYFDAMNVRNTEEWKRKQKPFLKPYTSINDERFHWFCSEFLPYLQTWKQSTQSREGNYSSANRSNMFLSYQTYESVLMSVYSLKESVVYLLNHGVLFVLSNRFCQDDLENYFGRQRAIGRRKDNPRVFDTGYNDNLIKSQFSTRPISGNVRGEKSKFDPLDDAPLLKRKKGNCDL